MSMTVPLHVWARTQAEKTPRSASAVIRTQTAMFAVQFDVRDETAELAREHPEFMAVYFCHLARLRAMEMGLDPVPA